MYISTVSYISTLLSPKPQNINSLTSNNTHFIPTIRLIIGLFVTSAALTGCVQGASEGVEEALIEQTDYTNVTTTTTSIIRAPNTGCSLTINPGDSFSSAFSQMSAGDTLCLNDGVYNQALDIPSNMHVQAVHDGEAEINGGGVLGEEWDGGLVQLKGNNASVRGLRVHHAGTNVHTCYMSGSNNTMQVMSCSHGGDHKHKIPLFMTGSGHLVEDSWFFGKGRYVMQCFTGHGMVIRRNVARWDVTTLNTASEPNAAFSI